MDATAAKTWTKHRKRLCGLILLVLLAGAEGPPIEAANATAPRRIRFDDLFVTGMARLLPGGGTLQAPGSARPVSAAGLTSERFIPNGSLVFTNARETARIRLGERSVLRLRPESAIRIFSLYVQIVRGQVGVQHGKTVFPLRLSAASSSLLLERESGADFFLPSDGPLLVTVQVGAVRISGTGRVFPSGSRIEIDKGVVNPDPPISHLMKWATAPRGDETRNSAGAEPSQGPSSSMQTPGTDDGEPAQGAATTDPATGALGDEQDQPLLDDVLLGHDPTREERP